MFFSMYLESQQGLDLAERGIFGANGMFAIFGANGVLLFLEANGVFLGKVVHFFCRNKVDSGRLGGRHARWFRPLAR